MKIKVLFVIMQMAMGGSERLVHNLVLNLDRNLFNPSIAWFFGDKVIQEFNDLGIPLYHIPKMRRFDYSTMRNLANVIKTNNIHIVNAHHFMPMVYSFYGCKINNHAKLIYTEHSEWELEKISWKWRKIGNYLLNRSDGIVGVSDAVSKKIKNILETDASKTFTIRNGVDLNAFSSNNKKPDLRRKLGLSDDEKVIGIVANFRRIKNHIFLLKAFNELTKDYKNVRLLLIGQGFESDPENSEREIRDFVNEKGLYKNVLFLSYRSDIPELLSIMDIFCLTSFKEGLPISLIEAMAAGLPVVGADVEGIRDVIIHDSNGFLVQVGNVKGMKDILYTLLENESMRHKFGQESRSFAKRTYSLDHCLNQYQDLFISMMKNDK